ncbi:MAG TPA: CCA tRNA nucleotidyltransferase [Nitrosopumilaceae archaeon]|nr:CCA tRNA nucleotidyltransferase [Nitrosopumilaceae archaeon]
MNQVINQARKLVIPSKKLEQDKTKIAKLAFELVRKEVTKFSQITGIEFGGSYVKGTWLPNKADIDIFVKFEKSTSDKKFVEISKKIGFAAMKKYKPYVRYSEHPYVEATVRDTKVNVVPCYDVKKGEWQSAADRSPFHTKFMLESLTGAMKDEVRLLKSFLTNNKIYGSEIAKQGISGYVTEVLILNYGSFHDVINAIAKLKKNQVIGKPTKSFDTSIIIIDPIDSNRNLGAAISNENVGKFIIASRAFQRKPSISFFKSNLKTKVFKNNLENTIAVEFNYKPRSPDIIWGQIKRAASSLVVQMELEGFRVFRHAGAIDEKNQACLLFLLQALKIEENFIREGPDVFFEAESATYITKNSKNNMLWIGTNRKILSIQKHRQNDIKLFLKDLLKNHLNKSGIPKGLKEDIKKKFRIIPAKNVTGKCIKEAVSELVSTDATILSFNK